jgi:hypothetical protein
LTASERRSESGRVIEDLSRNGIRRDLERYRGERFRVEPSPAWVSKRKVMNIERLPGEPVSVLLMDRQIHAPSNTRYTRIVRRLETHQALQDLGTVEIGFDPATQQLLMHGVSIFRSGVLHNHAVEGSFELFQREAGLENDILSGAVTSLLVLKDIRIGDVLDVEFSIVSDSGLFQNQYWFVEIIGNTHLIGRQWFSWIEREGQQLFVQAPEKLGTFVRDCTEHGFVRTWSFEFPPVVALENDIPVTYKPFPEISITSFGSWREVASMFLEPWSVEPADRGELDRELAPLRQRHASDPLAAISAAIDLVRNHVRYLGYSPGVFAHVPADPAHVWSRRFGDCKEKSRLLCWLLGELGIVADPVLVNTHAGAALEDQPPSPGVFDHVIVRICHEDTDLWVDPTDVSRRGKVADWKSLPFHCGLPLVSGSDQLIRIPADPKDASGLEVEEIITVDSKNRGATIEVTHTYRGRDADGMRHAMDSRGRTAVAKYILDQVKQTHPDAAASSELEVTDDPELNRFTLHCILRCENLLKPAQEGNADLCFLVPYSIPSCITGISGPRKHPLAIRHPVDVRHTIRLNSEDPRQVAIPKHYVASEFFWFSFTSTSTRSESIHTFTYQTRHGTVPANKARSYADDLTKISEALNWHIRFRTRGRKSFQKGDLPKSPESW